MRLVLILSVLCVWSISMDAQGHAEETPDRLCTRACADQAFAPNPLPSQSQGRNARAQPCSYSELEEFAQLSTTGLFQYLINEDDPFTCLYRKVFAYNNVYSSQLFSNANVNYISRQAVIYARLFNGQSDNGIYALFTYLSVASQMAQHYKNDITFTNTTWSNIESACVALAANPDALSESALSLRVVAEMMNTAARPYINGNTDILLFAEDLLQNLASGTYNNQTSYYNYYYCYYFLLDIYFRYAPENDDFIDALVANPSPITAMADVATNDELLDESYIYFADLSSFSVAALARLANYSELHGAIGPALLTITDHYEQTTPQWTKAAIALASNGLPFDMTEQQIIQSIEADLFPNTYEFDDGRFSVSTPLAYDEVLSLYQASQEVKSQFFRLLQDDTPVTGDTNDTLFIKLHGTRDSYRDFNGILFGVNYPNSGGVYIEDYATFYTYQRTSQESTYTLEELFRHEYTHYLQGRYIIPGTWGESPMYDNSRMVWFEEGMAQFLAGSTISDGIKNLELIRNRILSRGDVQDLNTVLSSSYSNGNADAFYIFGSMLWSSWYNEDYSRIKQLIDYLRDSNLLAFDQAIDQFKVNTAENIKYTNHVNSSLVDDSQWILPISTLVKQDDISFAGLSQIESDLTSVDAALSLMSSDINIISEPQRFTITASYQLSSPINDLDQFRSVLEAELDEILTDVREASDINAFDYSNGYFKNLVTGNTPSATFVFTGPINDACATPDVDEVLVENFTNYILLYAPDISSMRHQYRYKEKTSTQWTLLNQTSFSPESVVNLSSINGYDFQIQYECGDNIWSGYSASKDIYPCPDHSEFTIPNLDNDQKFFASKTIKSNSTVSAGANIGFTAGSSIELLPSFEVLSGSRLTLNMNNCRNKQ